MEELEYLGVRISVELANELRETAKESERTLSGQVRAVIKEWSEARKIAKAAKPR